MKKLILTFSLIICANFTLFAQDIAYNDISKKFDGNVYKKTNNSSPAVLSYNLPINTKVIPYNLEITDFGTTSLVFPSKIVSVDRGSVNIFAKKINEVQNILKVKAAKGFYERTNLTVVTADGNIYSFLVSYTDYLKNFVIDMGQASSYIPKKSISKGNKLVKFESTGLNDTSVERYAIKTLKSNKTIETQKADNIRLSMKKIFVKDDIIFFPVEVKNEGDLNYDIDFLKFFIKDKKRTKRGVTQTLEIKPVDVFNYKTVVNKKSKLIQVFAFKKFTINNDKKLDVVIYEKNGGRNITATLKYKDINNAKFIN